MLRALQSAADSYKAIYENFLTRYTQAVQDQSFPITEARVMSTAVPPLKKSWPKGVLVLGLAVVLGALLGWFGWYEALMGLLTGFVLGALVSIVLLALRRVGRGGSIPLGPAMLVGAYLWCVLAPLT